METTQSMFGRPRQLLRHIVWSTLAVCLFATSVFAQNGFTVGVSSDVNIQLNDPSVTAITGGNAANQSSFINTSQWRFTNVIATEFSRPEFLLINEPSSTDAITTLDIVIGDTDFNFDNLPVLPEFAALAAPALPIGDLAFPAGITASTVDLNGVTVDPGDAAADVLRIDFTGLAGGGLAPGETFTFITQLAADAPVLGDPPPAFDNSVLFGAIDGTLDNNAQSIVTFADSTQGTEIFEDFDPALQAPEGHSAVTRFFLPQFTVFETPSTVIPEPATGVQATLLLLLALGRRRARRSSAG